MSEGELRWGADESLLARDLLKEFGVRFYGDEWRFAIKYASAADRDVVFVWPKLLSAFNTTSSEINYGNTLREIAASLIVGVDGYRYSPGTVKAKISWLRWFFTTLSERGFERLSFLTTYKVREIFLGTIKNKYSGEINSSRTVSDRMGIVSQLYRLRGFLSDCLNEEPFPRRFKNKHITCLKPSLPWEAPPEPVSIFLIKMAISFIEELSGDLIRILKKYASAVKIAKANGSSSRKVIQRFARKSISSERFTGLNKCGELVGSYKATNSAHVAILIRHLQAACFVVITYTCGPRVSEVRRATSNSLKVEVDASGNDLAFYFAKRSKKMYAGASNMRVVSDDHDYPWVLSPAAYSAFGVLKDLSEPARLDCGVDNLWLTIAGRGLWPIYGVKGHQIAGSGTMNSRLQKFASLIDLSKRTGWTGTLHSHMGRKNLARFIAKRDRSVLEDLAVQYSHSSAYTIDVHYARPDSEFRRLVREELHKEMEAAATELVGLAPSVIYSKNKMDFESRPIAKFVGKTISEVELKTMLARGTILVPCQWGVCIYRQQTSACLGSKLEPNPIKRSPEICKGCSNFVATPKHKLWWENFRSDSVQLLRQSNLPMQTRLIIESRVKDADEILDVVGG